jgi:tRNA modification GTPase
MLVMMILFFASVKNNNNNPGIDQLKIANIIQFTLTFFIMYICTLQIFNKIPSTHVTAVRILYADTYCSLFHKHTRRCKPIHQLLGYQLSGTTSRGNANSQCRLVTTPAIIQQRRKDITGVRLRLLTNDNRNLCSKSKLDSSLTNFELDFSSRAADQNVDDRTIFALSTGTGVGGQATAVAVIRLSGPHSILVLEHMLLLHADTNANVNGSEGSIRTKKVGLPKPRYAAVRTLYNWITNDVLDNALVLYFRGPNSFTGEDIVELHCHGSRAVIQEVLSTLQQPINLQQNDGDDSSTNVVRCRMAEPGEFAQRAWTQGKLDLLQIEALADLLSSDTNAQLQQAIGQLDGSLSRIYTTWRTMLIEAMSHAEAVIDFGDDETLLEGSDDDIDFINDSNNVQQRQQNAVWGGVTEKIQKLRNDMGKHLQDSRRGELVRDGISIAIVGPPNAGKSSLFNLLAQRDVAIVSSIPGTTRDVIEIQLNLNGYKCRIQDTAGVRDAALADTIEQVGMDRAIQAAAAADLIIAVVDSSQLDEGYEVLTKVIQEITKSSDHNGCDSSLEMTTSSPFGKLPNNVMLLLNKSDLKLPADSPIETNTFHHNQLRISCATQDGIDTFLESLAARVQRRIMGDDNSSVTSESYHDNSVAYISRARHRQHVQNAVDALSRFENLATMNGRDTLMMADIATEELRLASSEIGRIIGAIDVEDVLDKLFSDFCIGK